MANSEETVQNLMKSGNMSAEQLRDTFADASATASPVNITGWQACYSSATGQLSAFCTVTSTNSGNPITGLGMIVYSSNGAQMFCVQYNNGTKSTQIDASIGTGLYTTQMGNSVLCVVYGWTDSGNFYSSQTLTVGNCE